MTCYPVEVVGTKKDVKPSIVNRMMLIIGMVMFVALATVNPAAATIDWTNITETINGVAGIMPSIAGVITAVVEPMILLAVVGFIIGLFDGILGGITNALSFRR